MAGPWNGPGRRSIVLRLWDSYPLSADLIGHRLPDRIPAPTLFLHAASCAEFSATYLRETLVASIRPRWEVQPWESTVNPSDDLGYIGYRVVGFLIINWSV